MHHIAPEQHRIAPQQYVIPDMIRTEEPHRVSEYFPTGSQRLLVVTVEEDVVPGLAPVTINILESPKEGGIFPRGLPSISVASASKSGHHAKVHYYLFGPIVLITPLDILNMLQQ
jgi:hypothetical protein